MRKSLICCAKQRNNKSLPFFISLCGCCGYRYRSSTEFHPNCTCAFLSFSLSLPLDLFLPQRESEQSPTLDTLDDGSSTLRELSLSISSTYPGQFVHGKPERLRRSTIYGRAMFVCIRRASASTAAAAAAAVTVRRRRCVSRKERDSSEGVDQRADHVLWWCRVARNMFLFWKKSRAGWLVKRPFLPTLSLGPIFSFSMQA